MDEGHVVACGTLPELLALSCATEVIELRLAAPLRAIDGVRGVEAVGLDLHVFASRAQRVLPRLYRVVAALGHSVGRTRVTPVTLEDVFLELTGRGPRD